MECVFTNKNLLELFVKNTDTNRTNSRHGKVLLAEIFVIKRRYFLTTFALPQYFDISSYWLVDNSEDFCWRRLLT